MAITVETSIDIDAAPGLVWATLMDFDRYPEWNPFIRRISGTPSLGERLDVALGPVGRTPMRFRPEVMTVEPERAFHWLGTLVIGQLFRGRHEFDLTPRPDGGTRFDHRERFGGLLVLPMRRSLNEDTRGGFEAMNDALKRRVESAAFRMPSGTESWPGCS